MRPKLKDIADRVGVTPQLVSFYLNHPRTTRVRKETRAKIDAAVKALDYRVNAVGRALSIGKTNTIGLIMGGFSARIRGCYVHSLMNEAKRCGYNLLIAITNYDHREELNALEMMLDRQVDGIIYTLDLEDGCKIAQRIQKLQFPLLLHAQTPHKAFDTIGHDYRGSVVELAQFLRTRGRKTLYFQENPQSEVCGWLSEAASQCGLQLRIFPLPEDPFVNGDFLHAVLRDRPDAILEFNEKWLRVLLEMISAENPEYRPDCIGCYELPFQYVESPLVAGYVRTFHHERAVAEVEHMIELINAPHSAFRNLRLPTCFLSAEEARKLRLEQLESPLYRQFR